MTPFLKWAGGKRWLFNSKFIQNLPAFERYIEPFLGGGAGFFAINPSNAILSDINIELIELYEVIRDSAKDLMSKLCEHNLQHNNSYYYEIRNRNFTNKIDRAARMLYLNRTCWNGLYRLNQSGFFNVPRGTKDTVLLATDDFNEASKRLKTTTLICCDFENTINQSKKGDLIFVDPPYTVQHNNNGFIKYNERLFSWEDQVRLRSSLGQAHHRGAAIIITNADHSSIRNLYKGFGSHKSIDRASIISGKSSGRSKTTELMVIA